MRLLEFAAASASKAHARLVAPRRNPQIYFTDLLTRLVNGWPQKRIDELLPWHWTPQPTP
jgi:hypothetical protein